MGNEPPAPSGIAVGRLPLLLLGFLALFAGVGAGLARLGWTVPQIAATAAALHGPLMISGFFGVVIALERAVAIGRRWAYLGPLAAGLGGIAAIAGTTTAAAWLFVAGSAVLLAATLDIFRRQSALFTLTLVAGSLAWTVGSVLWATGSDIGAVVAWWLAFPILTIAGERLELSRFLRPSPIAQSLFAVLLVVIGTGSSVRGRRGARRRSRRGCSRFRCGSCGTTSRAARCAARDSRASSRCACWRATHGSRRLPSSSSPPAASRRERRRGTPPCTRWRWASCSRWCSATRRSSSRRCCGCPLPYHPAFYVPLALLHTSLIVRLAGDATGRFDWTRAGGLLNAIALAAFILGTAAAVTRGLRAKAAAP